MTALLSLNLAKQCIGMFEAQTSKYLLCLRIQQSHSRKAGLGSQGVFCGHDQDYHDSCQPHILVKTPKNILCKKIYSPDKANGYTKAMHDGGSS